MGACGVWPKIPLRRPKNIRRGGRRSPSTDDYQLGVDNVYAWLDELDGSGFDLKKSVEVK